MKNDIVIKLENKLHGYHTRLKELHYSAPSISMHKIIDDFDESLQEFDDNIMEDSQAIFGFIEPGELSPELPDSLEIEDLLVELRNDIGDFMDAIGNSSTWTGVRNEVEDFWHVLNKTIYLVKIAKK